MKIGSLIVICLLWMVGIGTACAQEVPPGAEMISNAEIKASEFTKALDGAKESVLLKSLLDNACTMSPRKKVDVGFTLGIPLLGEALIELTFLDKDGKTLPDIEPLYIRLNGPEKELRSITGTFPDSTRDAVSVQLRYICTVDHLWAIKKVTLGPAK
jgi:hypothetical protein